ncbi:MAG: M17 family peptidase N-terminal domain-containing protein [Desulfatiglandaceae bacterium]
MKLDLRFVNVPLEELWCEVVAALVFEEPFESQGPIYALDTKTGGYLSFLSEGGFWMGSEGSTLLLASEKKIRSDKIVLRGLGPRADCSPESFVGHVAELGNALALLKCHDLGVWIPCPGESGKKLDVLFRGACETLLNAYLEKEGDNAQDSFLKVVFSMPHGSPIDLEKTAAFLRKKFSSRYNCSVVVMGEEHERVSDTRRSKLG